MVRAEPGNKSRESGPICQYESAPPGVCGSGREGWAVRFLPSGSSFKKQGDCLLVSSRRVEKQQLRHAGGERRSCSFWILVHLSVLGRSDCKLSARPGVRTCAGAACALLHVNMVSYFRGSLSEPWLASRFPCVHREPWRLGSEAGSRSRPEGRVPVSVVGAERSGAGGEGGNGPAAQVFAV